MDLFCKCFLLHLSGKILVSCHAHPLYDPWVSFVTDTYSKIKTWNCYKTDDVQITSVQSFAIQSFNEGRCIYQLLKLYWKIANGSVIGRNGNVIAIKTKWIELQLQHYGLLLLFKFSDNYGVDGIMEDEGGILAYDGCLPEAYSG
ncbi:hypothetical protein L6452_32017 [Arctium lappa]|uniref:Uncharacterized protein n=1 Tax=Arctium lappa TaxID=4217 RepID=A0ACB8Z413_ARCLA|nr:hypothetical protein L6452_32017 [Arctium lappa]